MKKQEIKNPFQKADGGPIYGKEDEFFKWARTKEMERRKTLPKDVQVRLAEADRNLQDKMNS